MKRKLWLDVDGVLRDLSFAMIGKDPDSWIDKIGNETFNEYIDNRMNILLDAPPTIYFPVICEFLRKTRDANVITCQPINWIPNTLKWLDKSFKEYGINKYNINVVSKIPEKEKYISNKEILLEDYPFFTKRMKSRTILIDKPYNKESNNYIIRVYSPVQLRQVLEEYVA